MRTYYRDDSVHITSTAIRVGDRHFALDQLDQLWRTDRRVAGRRIMMGIGVLLAATGFTALVRYTWWFGGLRLKFQHWLAGGPAVLAGVAVAGLVLAVLGVLAIEAALRAIEDIRGHARHLELWAVVRGRPVLLLHTDDADRFGKVCRALTRARSG
jgi:Family of unknown function (DUF6232)